MCKCWGHSSSLRIVDRRRPLTSKEPCFPHDCPSHNISHRHQHSYDLTTKQNKTVLPYCIFLPNVSINTLDNLNAILLSGTIKAIISFSKFKYQKGTRKELYFTQARRCILCRPMSMLTKKNIHRICPICITIVPCKFGRQIELVFRRTLFTLLHE